MLRDIRNNYSQKELRKADVDNSPFFQFRKWLNEAIDQGVNEPTAMILSTVDEEKRPHSRVVLLKEITDAGFVFFTNYTSNKGKHIVANSYVSLTFFWPELERQVRIDGNVEKVSAEISDEYFSSRPLDSQLGAWASPQSQVIDSKEVLIENFEKYRNLYGNKIPRPLNWGGYLVKPYYCEFWQGRPNRLHDRISYRLEEGNWNIVRMAP